MIRRDYELLMQDEGTGSVASVWTSGARSGSRIDMNALIREHDTKRHDCPSCGAQNRYPSLDLGKHTKW